MKKRVITTLCCTTMAMISLSVKAQQEPAAAPPTEKMNPSAHPYAPWPMPNIPELPKNTPAPKIEHLPTIYIVTPAKSLVSTCLKNKAYLRKGIFKDKCVISYQLIGDYNYPYTTYVLWGADEQGHWILQNFEGDTGAEYSDPYAVMPPNADDNQIDANKLKPVDGLRLTWYASGGLSTREHYVDGVPEGLYEYWEKSGIQTVQMHYRKGKQEGEYRSWYDNGQMFQWTMSPTDMKDGFDYQWDKNGTMMSQGFYVKGKAVGPTMSTAVDAASPDDAPAYLYFYRNYDENGQLHGLSRQVRSNGVIESEANYEHGELLNSKEWSGGQLTKEIQRTSAQHWHQKEWHSNGQLAAEGDFDGEKKLAGWKYWNKKGNISTERRYQQPSF